MTHRPSDAVADRAREAIGTLLAGADAARDQVAKNVEEMKRLEAENTMLLHRASINEMTAGFFEHALTEVGVLPPDTKVPDVVGLTLFERMSIIARSHQQKVAS